VAPARDRQALARLASALESAKVRLAGADGQKLAIPASLRRILLEAARQLAHGNGVSLLPVTTELTTQEAGDLLSVSRPHLVKLLEEGEIPFHKTGTHRRVALGDLLAYKERRDRVSRETLDGLVAEAQDLGIYDE
jgi:excisionase family DNA binding protein